MTLLDFFDADISGRDFAQGKPHPEIFLTAAAELGVAPAGVLRRRGRRLGLQAAKAGGMAALGVARADDEELLAGAGADLVVTTLDDVDLSRLAQAACRQRRRRRFRDRLEPRREVPQRGRLVHDPVAPQLAGPAATRSQTSIT